MTQKLILNKETIRRLSEDQILQTVEGASEATYAPMTDSRLRPTGCTIVHTLELMANFGNRADTR